jgi:hypothetical protein
MQCPSCGGAFEWAGNGQHARCTRCLALFNNQNGQLTPIQVQAPGGGHNPEFNAMFAQNLGFGPPPPGAGMQQPYGQPQQQAYGQPPQQQAYGQQPYGQQQQQPNDFAKGTFDMGGGQHVKLTIDGRSPENFLKNKASSMIWGWIIGAVILGIMLITGLGFGIYIYMQASDSGSAGSAAKAAAAASWDGTSTFECKGNDAVSLSGVKAKVAGTAVKASGNCQLTLVGVDLTAATGIEASGNAKVTMTGGSIKATSNSVVASAAAKVTCVGTTVTGKSKASGAAKVTGAN